MYRHEVRRGGVVLAVIEGDDREASRLAALRRAVELKGLSYEIRNPRWAESDHWSFPCRELDAERLAVETPIGTFTLPARRAKAGELVTAVAGRGGMVGFGRTAIEDQTSLPARVHGRLNPPDAHRGWRYQPSLITYADGSSSDYLGDSPMEVTWIEGPVWKSA